jgi:hypothetical protein
VPQCATAKMQESRINTGWKACREPENTPK